MRRIGLALLVVLAVGLPLAQQRRIASLTNELAKRESQHGPPEQPDLRIAPPPDKDAQAVSVPSAGSAAVVVEEDQEVIGPADTESEEQPVEELLEFSGFDTPEDAVKSILWAKFRNDKNVLLSSFVWKDSAIESKAQDLFLNAPDAIRAKYRSGAEMLFDLLGGPHKSDIGSYELVSREIDGETALLEVEWQSRDGTRKVEPLEMLRVGGEWKQVLDVADRLFDHFAGQMQEPME